MAYLSLAAVSAAIYSTLNVAALTAIAPGGVRDFAPPVASAYPWVMFTVSEETQVGGFGTKPGTHAFPQVRVRVNVFSTYSGFSEAQTVMSKVIELLADPPAVTGYSAWAIFHDSTTPLSGQVVGGVVVNEMVSDFRLYVEEA